MTKNAMSTDATDTDNKRFWRAASSKATRSPKPTATSSKQKTRAIRKRDSSAPGG